MSGPAHGPVQLWLGRIPGGQQVMVQVALDATERLWYVSVAFRAQRHLPWQLVTCDPASLEDVIG